MDQSIIFSKAPKSILRFWSNYFYTVCTLGFISFQFPHRTSGPEEAQPRPDQSCFQEAICMVAEVHQEQNRRDRYRIRVCKSNENQVMVNLEETPAMTVLFFRFPERGRRIWKDDRSSNRPPRGRPSQRLRAETSNKMAIPIKASQWTISARRRRRRSDLRTTSCHKPPCFELYSIIIIIMYLCP